MSVFTKLDYQRRDKAIAAACMLYNVKPEDIMSKGKGRQRRAVSEAKTMVCCELYRQQYTIVEIADMLGINSDYGDGATVKWVLKRAKQYGFEVEVRPRGGSNNGRMAKFARIAADHHKLEARVDVDKDGQAISPFSVLGKGGLTLWTKYLTGEKKPGEFTTNQIALMFNVSVQRVDQICDAAMDKLRGGLRCEMYDRDGTPMMGKEPDEVAA